jgi:hypothetical protein
MIISGYGSYYSQLQVSGLSNVSGSNSDDDGSSKNLFSIGSKASGGADRTQLSALASFVSSVPEELQDDMSSFSDTLKSSLGSDGDFDAEKVASTASDELQAYAEEQGIDLTKVAESAYDMKERASSFASRFSGMGGIGGMSGMPPMGGMYGEEEAQSTTEDDITSLLLEALEESEEDDETETVETASSETEETDSSATEGTTTVSLPDELSDDISDFASSVLSALQGDSEFSAEELVSSLSEDLQTYADENGIDLEAIAEKAYSKAESAMTARSEEAKPMGPPPPPPSETAAASEESSETESESDLTQSFYDSFWGDDDENSSTGNYEYMFSRMMNSLYFDA